jgi:hypothetical protein
MPSPRRSSASKHWTDRVVIRTSETPTAYELSHTPAASLQSGIGTPWSGPGPNTATMPGDVLAAFVIVVRCGYEAQLLVQFAPEADGAEAIVTELLAGVLAGLDVFRTEWPGHRQLWLQDRSADWELKRRIQTVVTAERTSARIRQDWPV